jgi:hypothetical protein
MKTCYKCCKELNESNARKSILLKGGVKSGLCRECDKIRVKAYNKTLLGIKASQRRNQKRRKQARLKADAIKISKGCVDCPVGTVWHPVALQFDHIDPSQKLFTIATFINRSWPIVLREIEKCVVRCANHHAIKHFYQTKKGFKSHEETLL